MRTILHIDFNSYFARVEQQANPRLRGKPIGVTGGDKDPYRSRSGDIIALAHGTLPSPNGERRLGRTVIGAASVEAKKLGVKTGMSLGEALKICPKLILVKGDSDKYLYTSQKFLNILKDCSPKVELFSIDEAFIELKARGDSEERSWRTPAAQLLQARRYDEKPNWQDPEQVVKIALDIKQRIKEEVGEWITCSIGISYNKFMAKLAGSLYKPDGLVAILDEEAAIRILDQVELDEVCGIGFRIKRRLNNMGIFNFSDLRKVQLEYLLASFKSYGEILYKMSRGLDDSPVVPFYEKEEVKSVGHRHTLDHDTKDSLEIKQITLKITELIARRLRAKKLLGKTVSVYFRYSLERSYNPGLSSQFQSGIGFEGDRVQTTILHSADGLDLFNAAFKAFLNIWDYKEIRMIGVSVSNLKPKNPETLSFLEESKRKEVITKALDYINNRYGEFTLQRGVLLNSVKVYRKANPFMADRRFKL